MATWRKWPTSARCLEYHSWRAMRNRCFNPHDPKYPVYGGAGIRICDRWRDNFNAFLSDMGPRPTRAHSLDRIDTRGHYEPGNCRWATQTTQQRNRTSTKLSAELIPQLRVLRDGGLSHKAIAVRFAVSETTVREALSGHTWGPEPAVALALARGSGEEKR